MESITYRIATLDDIDAACAIREHGEAGGDSPARTRLYLSGEHHPQHALAPRRMWVAETDGRIVGYIAGHLTRRFDCEGELQWIYVAREHRRRGIGAELVRILASWFSEQNASRVCVDVGDESALPFYASLGAVPLRPHWMVWEHIESA